MELGKITQVDIRDVWPHQGLGADLVVWVRFRASSVISGACGINVVSSKFVQKHSWGHNGGTMGRGARGVPC